MKWQGPSWQHREMQRREARQPKPRNFLADAHAQWLRTPRTGTWGLEYSPGKIYRSGTLISAWAGSITLQSTVAAWHTEPWRTG